MKRFIIEGFSGEENKWINLFKDSRSYAKESTAKSVMGNKGQYLSCDLRVSEVEIETELEKANREIEKWRLECSGMGKLLQSGVVYTYKEIEERSQEIQKRDKLLERANAAIEAYKNTTNSETRWLVLDQWQKHYEELKK